MSKIRKTIAILLAVLFVVTVTTGALSAWISRDPIVNSYEKASVKGVGYKNVEMVSTQNEHNTPFVTTSPSMYTHAEHL